RYDTCRSTGTGWGHGRIPPYSGPSFVPGPSVEVHGVLMDPFKNAPLRYRFDDLSQARAHVVSVEYRALFFFRHKDLELVPGSALQMEWTFQGSEPARLLHGVALSNVRKCGAWIELQDARPLRELSIIRHERKHRRMATDLSADVVRGGSVSRGRHPSWCCAEHGSLEVPLPEAALLRAAV